MPKIFFEGRDYENPEQMTPEARARYEKAVQMLPDRDKNGIPDLLESDGIPAETPPPVTPVASGAEPEVRASTPQTRKAALTAARNRKRISWAVIGIVVLCIGCFSIFMVIIFSLLRSSEAYRMAVEAAKNHPTAQQVLGVPIQDGVFTTGSVSESGSTGSADLEIPLNGSNQSGTLYVTAVKEENTWRLTSLLLEVGGQEYQLLQ